MNHFDIVDPFNKNDITNQFLKLIYNKDLKFLLEIKIILQKRLEEFV